MREGAAGYRQVQEWVAEGRFAEAATLAEELLVDPALGRSKRAQLHSLACWLYDGPLGQSGPRAVLHGEEAVRLLTLLHDPWHRAAAQANLIGARIHMGDSAGAAAELRRLEAEVAESPGLFSDGDRTLFVLNLLLAAAGGEWAEALALLRDVAPQADCLEIELIRAWAMLQSGAPPESVRRLLPPIGADPVLASERSLLEARIAQIEGAPIDEQAAIVALLRLSAAGRRDLLSRLSLPETPEDKERHRDRGRGERSQAEGAQP